MGLFVLAKINKGKKPIKQSHKMIFTQARCESGISRSLPLRVNPITVALCWFLFVILSLVTGDAQPSFTLLTRQESLTSLKKTSLLYTTNKEPKKSNASRWMLLLDTGLISQTVLTSDPVGGLLMLW